MKTLNDSNPKGNPLPSDQINQNLTTAQEAEIFNNGPESPDERLSNGAVKGVAWLGAIFGIFAVAILIAWICNLHHSPSTPFSARTNVERTIKVAPNSNLNPNLAKVSLPTIGKLTVVPTKITVIGSNASNFLSTASSNLSLQTPGTVAKVKSESIQMVTDSKADMDRIEKEALEVIHGDYGNNPGRAEKLGADYAAVQARVNQLLHI